MKRTRSWGRFASVFLLAASAVPGSAATLDHVRESGQIRLGYVEGARPYSYRDESGNASGYSVALCQTVAHAVKTELNLPQLRIEYVLLGAEDRFDAVKQGKVDLLCAAGTPTVARREAASFSIPVFLGGVAALIHDDAPANMRAVLEQKPEPFQPRWRASLNQVLRDRVYVAARGTTMVEWLSGKIAELGIPARAETVDTFAEGVDRVADRSADVFFGDRALLLDAAMRSPHAGDLVLLERHFTYEAPALALQRDDEEFRLLVDRTLSRLFRSGEIAAIYTPYFGKPEPQTLHFLQANSLAE
jgi:ABC-type amino acid transport substrate-binding protein